MDAEAAEQAQWWIESVTGEAFPSGFDESLKDGRLLCMLVNAIRRGSVRRINESRMPFKQMENISAFLRACRDLGVAEHNLFETVDLFEAKDIGLVVKTIHALGRAVQTSAPEFGGPHLGRAEVTRESSAPRFRVSASGASGTVSKLNMGSSAVMERTHVSRSNDVAFGANSSGIGDTRVNTRLGETRMQRQPILASGPTFGAAAARGRAELGARGGAASKSSSQPAPPKAPPRPSPTAAGYAPPPVPSRPSVDRAATYSSPHSSAARPSVGRSGTYGGAGTGYPASAGAAAGTRGAGYGLDAALAAQQAAKYDVGLEAEAQAWLESLTGSAFPGDFAESLRDGRILCQAINAIKPGTVARINTSRMPFKQMENVSNFLRACRTLGVAEHDLFETVDLYDAKDLGVVVTCIHALGRAAQKLPGYGGPTLGVREASANVRTFSEEQKQMQRAASAMPSRQTMGSSSTMQRQEVLRTGVNFGNAMAGGGDAASVPQQNMGSVGVMERSEAQYYDPTFGHRAGRSAAPPVPPRRY